MYFVVTALLDAVHIFFLFECGISFLSWLEPEGGGGVGGGGGGNWITHLSRLRSFFLLRRGGGHRPLTETRSLPAAGSRPLPARHPPTPPEPVTK
jgi:hypothetical protein